MSRPIVAVVEDDPFAAELASLWLEQSGYRARVFADARSFHERAPETQYAAIVLDWNLPDANGDQLLAWLRTNPIAPCVVLSGDSDPALRARALEGGAVAFLLKPVQPEELDRALGSAIRENART